MSIKAGLINNCSAARFTLLDAPPGIKPVYANPKDIAQMASAQTIDCGLISLAAALHLHDSFSSLPYGIASKSKTGSVKLFANKPRETLITGQWPITLAPESLTAVLLLKILSQMSFNQSPVIAIGKQAAVACLLIGDAALQESQTRKWPYEYDMGQWWFEQTGLPMVYSVWMINRQVDNADVILLEAWINANLAYANTAEGVTQFQQKLPLDKLQAQGYAESIYHHLGAEEQHSMQLFKTLRDRYGL